MQVFKAFFKIMRQNIGSASISLFLFIGISIFFTASNANTEMWSFQQQSSNVAFINEDIESEVVKGLYDTLAEGNTVKNVKNDKEAMQDALFYRETEYILIVPEGFTDKFLQGQEVTLQKMAVADANSNVYLDMKINRFLNNIKLYESYTKLEPKEYIQTILANDKNQVEVSVVQGEKKELSLQKMDYAFNYSSYAIISILLYCISSFLMKFNKQDVRKRLHCAPVSQRKINMQVFLAIILCGLGVFLLIAGINCLLYRQEIFTVKGAFQLLNMFVYTIFCACFAFTIGNVIHSDMALPAVVNIFSLAFSFLGGVFVPQAMLGDKVLMVGSLTPAYWFINASNAIVQATSFQGDTLKVILQNMGVVLLYGMAVLAIGLVITKQRKQKE